MLSVDDEWTTEEEIQVGFSVQYRVKIRKYRKYILCWFWKQKEARQFVSLLSAFSCTARVASSGNKQSELKVEMCSIKNSNRSVDFLAFFHGVHRRSTQQEVKPQNQQRADLETPEDDVQSQGTWRPRTTTIPKRRVQLHASDWTSDQDSDKCAVERGRRKLLQRFRLPTCNAQASRCEDHSARTKVDEVRVEREQNTAEENARVAFGRVGSGFAKHPTAQQQAASNLKS